MKRMCVDVTVRLWVEVDDKEVTTTSQLIDKELWGHYTLNDAWAVTIQDQTFMSANIVDKDLG